MKRLSTMHASFVEQTGKARQRPAIAVLAGLAITTWALAGCASANPAAVAAPEATIVAQAPTAAATVVLTATPAPTTSQDLRNAQYQGISFSYPAALAQDIQGETAPAVEGGSDAPWWMPAPQHTEIGLTGYVLPNTKKAPRILVYPAAEYAAASPEAAGRINNLRQLLQSKPEDAGAELPFLPLLNEAQQMRVGVEYLSFPGGQGVRYLTQHGQGPTPINNHELFYTFQGLTDDGKYWIAAILPVSHSTLPADVQSMPQSERDAAAADFLQYLSNTVKALEAQSDASFKPALSDLDALAQSIKVNP